MARQRSGRVLKKKLVDSPKPFTDWVGNGAKEEEWQEFLKNHKEKESREAHKTCDRLLKVLKESGIDWEEPFEKPVYWVCTHAFAHDWSSH